MLGQRAQSTIQVSQTYVVDFRTLQHCLLTCTLPDMYVLIYILCVVALALEWSAADFLTCMDTKRYTQYIDVKTCVEEYRVRSQ